MALSTVGTMLSVDGVTLENKLWKKLPIGKNREDENQRYVNDSLPTKEKEKKIHCDRNTRTLQETRRQ